MVLVVTENIYQPSRVYLNSNFINDLSTIMLVMPMDRYFMLKVNKNLAKFAIHNMKVCAFYYLSSFVFLIKIS